QFYDQYNAAQEEFIYQNDGHEYVQINFEYIIGSLWINIQIINVQILKKQNKNSNKLENFEVDVTASTTQSNDQCKLYKRNQPPILYIVAKIVPFQRIDAKYNPYPIAHLRKVQVQTLNDDTQISKVILQVLSKAAMLSSFFFSFPFFFYKKNRQAKKKFG
ncbi:hypothetical protein RFI_24892, partial [Reticulomyxa filosa]